MSANTAICVRASPNTTENRNANLMPSTRLMLAKGLCAYAEEAGWRNALRPAGIAWTAASQAADNYVHKCA